MSLMTDLVNVGQLGMRCNLVCYVIFLLLPTVENSAFETQMHFCVGLYLACMKAFTKWQQSLKTCD